ncbi:MAG TPA: hypothetical protein VEJ86_02885 [Candidatus Binataceae bacterium]|nr:hypothetical protein [Candidatus Binataceae bacterium]
MFEKLSEVVWCVELRAVDVIEERTEEKEQRKIYVREHEQPAGPQRSRRLSDARGLIDPVMERHGAESRIERGVFDWQSRRIPLLEVELGITLVLPQRLGDHFLRYVDSSELRLVPAASGSFQKAAGAATDIEKIVGRGACRRACVQRGIVYRGEDQLLEDAAVIAGRPPVESHGLRLYIIDR